MKVRDGYENRIRVYNHSQQVEDGPLLVMTHGGGFCIGNLEQEEKYCRGWTSKYRRVEVSIEHCFASDHDWPTELNDAWDTAKWASRTSSTNFQA